MLIDNNQPNRSLVYPAAICPVEPSSLQARFTTHLCQYVPPPSKIKLNNKYMIAGQLHLQFVIENLHFYTCFCCSMKDKKTLKP